MHPSLTNARELHLQYACVYLDVCECAVMGLEQEVARGGGWFTEELGFQKLNQEWWGFPTEVFVL